MRKLLMVLLVCAPVFAADGSEEKAAVAAVQKLFDAMAAHDSEAAKAILLPEGRVLAIRGDGSTTGGTQEQFAARLSGMKEPMVERMWNPTVLVRGRMAQVWAEYDFHRDGKFSHCGVDSVSLVKTAEGWKIAGVVYTVETEGCKSPQ